EKKKTLQEIAFAIDLGFSMPAGMEPYLDETAYYDTTNCTWPFGTHIAIVEVDEETGETELKRYIAVDDVGKKINPMIVDGQLHGGIAQGVGQALWERAVYSDDGQLLSGSMMDYALPRAAWLPSFELDETVTPSPVNPIGVKGVGEAGAIASTAAVANAVNDALAPLGIANPDKLVDIGRLKELKGVRRLPDGRLAIGALTTYSELLESPAREYGLIRDVLPGIGDVQVRNRGTVGGAIAHSDPASDLPAVLLALEGEIVARSKQGERTIPADGFFQGSFSTALADDEIVTEVR